MAESRPTLILSLPARELIVAISPFAAATIDPVAVKAPLSALSPPWICPRTSRGSITSFVIGSISGTDPSLISLSPLKIERPPERIPRAVGSGIKNQAIIGLLPVDIPQLGFFICARIDGAAQFAGGSKNRRTIQRRSSSTANAADHVTQTKSYLNG